MASTKRAKLFWSGRSQAVRLPKEFRFEGTEVHIRRQGKAVVLEPAARRWPDDYFELFGRLDEDVRRDQPEAPRAARRPVRMKYLLDTNICIFA